MCIAYWKGDFQYIFGSLLELTIVYKLIEP